MSDSEGKAARPPRKTVKPAGSLSPETPDSLNYDWLGRSLKQLFDDIAKEPIPQRIVDKLKELEGKEGKDGA